MFINGNLILLYITKTILTNLIIVCFMFCTQFWKSNFIILYYCSDLENLDFSDTIKFFLHFVWIILNYFDSLECLNCLDKNKWDHFLFFFPMTRRIQKKYYFAHLQKAVPQRNTDVKIKSRDICHYHWSIYVNIYSEKFSLFFLYP